MPLIQKIRGAEPAKPRKYQGELPPALEEIILRLLAKRPEERYQSAAELLAELAKLLA